MRKEHVFLSYCRDNSPEVSRLRDALVASGESVWWDRDILPGQDWKLAIRLAMQKAYVVLFCISHETESRTTSGMYSEILDAIDAYRQYAPGSVFLIPVRLSDCTIPPIEIDATRSLDRLQTIDLFTSATWQHDLARLVQAIRSSPGHPSAGTAGAAPPTTSRQTNPAITKGVRQLRQGSYSLAQKTFLRLMEEQEDCPEAYYYGAICLLQGKPPQSATLKTARQAEAMAVEAQELSPGQGRFDLLLAAIRHHFYGTHGLRCDPPFADELLESAQRKGVATEEMEELYSLLKIDGSFD